MKRTSHPGDLTMRYMHRFRCIGPECEDNCCHGWTVEVDAPAHERMQKLTQLHSPAERRRYAAAVAHVELGGKKHARRTTVFRLRGDGTCVMLEKSGLCHIQGTFGEKLLSDVCAIYPRRVQKVGEALELSGMVSCPEMSRQLLLHADATDEVPLDRAILPRPTATHGMDPRDIRPYWRLLVRVRTFILGLLRRPGYTLEQRLFFICWFAKRASPTLNKKVMKADVAAVLAEMKSLEGDATLAELARRYDGVAADSAIVLVLARELVRARNPKKQRRSFRELVDEVFAEYQSVRAYKKGDLESPEAESHAKRLWAEYRKRRARVVDRAAARVDQYVANIAHNYWMHRLPLEAPDLMVHMLRLLALLSVFKLLLFSHPSVQRDGDDLEARLDATA
ncbi:MAG TPA: flagellin lysine-N-methylase, partial [Polyangia bacterium]|nr:flagellin lysine-N-methylase [Polyangia bacterium]